MGRADTEELQVIKKSRVIVRLWIFSIYIVIGRLRLSNFWSAV